MTKGRRPSNTRTPQLFASDPDVFHNAHLDRGFTWGLYADGYRRAAELLVRRARTYHDRKLLGYPIIFLYRQYLELGLKYFIIQGNRVVETCNTLPMHHDLNALWDICHRIARERGLPISDDQLRLIEQYVDEFQRFDPTSEAFRYPVTKRNKPSIRDRAKRFSLRGLAAAMTRFSKAFRELSGLLDADVDIQDEFEHDAY